MAVCSAAPRAGCSLALPTPAVLMAVCSAAPRAGCSLALPTPAMLMAVCSAAPAADYRSTSMANSGQLSAQSWAFSSSSAGTSPVDEQHGVALLVDVEELGRQRVAAVVALAGFAVEDDAASRPPP